MTRTCERVRRTRLDWREHDRRETLPRRRARMSAVGRIVARSAVPVRRHLVLILSSSDRVFTYRT